MNEQPQEGPIVGDGSSLDVIKIWKTIQGEGPFVGSPAIFVRLAGCNLLCPACDTDYTSDRHQMTVKEILDEVAFSHPIRLVVLTGGEPLRQNIAPLVSQLLQEDYRVQLETNGTLYRQLPWNDITTVCSPKTPRLHPDLIPHIDTYKYVLQAGQVSEIGLPLTTMGSGLRPYQSYKTLKQPGVDVFVQPLDEKDGELNAFNLQAAIDSCMTYGWRLSVQTHKIIGLE